MVITLCVLLFVLSCVFNNSFGFNIKTKSNRMITSKLFALVQVNNLDNKKTIEIEAGSPLSLACVRADLRLSFQCKAGNCRSCELLMNGQKVLSCQTKVPAKKSITIKKIK